MGLWGFDLVEVGLMQSRVAASRAGAVNAAEYSLAQLLGALPLLAAVFLQSAERFEWLVLGSAAAILLAALLVTVYVCRRPKDGRAEKGLEVPLDSEDIVED
jgi:predicted acylesterase/phospholipase RssA